MTSELDPKLKHLLTDYRQQRTPPRAVRERGLTALGARIAAGDPGLDLSGEGSGAAGGKTGASLSMKALGVAGIVLAGGAGWWWWAGKTSSETPEPQARIAAPAEHETASAAPAPPTQIEKSPPSAPPNGATLPGTDETSSEPPPASVPALRKTPGRREQEAAKKSQASASTLREEMELMSRGQSALQAGNAAAALDAFEQHRRRFPSGSLAAEREVKRVVALCQLGRRSEARATAERFAKAYPGSPLTQHALNACGGQP